MSLLKLCQSPGCGRPVLARGYCRCHYDRLRKQMDPNTPIRENVGLKELPRCRVAPQTYVALSRYAEALGISLYEAERRVLDSWAQQYAQDEARDLESRRRKKPGT